MKNWIFQGKPSRYDVADRRKVDEGKEETWLVTRYREEMRPGDIVYFWRSGEKDKRGIYAWGKIKSDPTFYEDWGWGVPVTYEKRFPEHLPANEIQTIPEMENHLLFKMPIGTNFNLSEEEAGEVERMIMKKFGDEFVNKEGNKS